MKYSTITFTIGIYFALVAYIVSLMNALRGTSDGALVYLHALGALGFMLVAILFEWAENYNKR